MLEGKAVIGETDMLQSMQQDALDLAAKALDFFDVTDSTDIARFVKKVTLLCCLLHRTHTWHVYIYMCVCIYTYSSSGVFVCLSCVCNLAWFSLWHFNDTIPSSLDSSSALFSSRLVIYLFIYRLGCNLN